MDPKTGIPSLISPPSKILVTGANGYIAMWVIQHLLLQGYRVRGTVRALNKASDLQELFGGDVKEGMLEFTVVDDIVKDGAFDEAVKDVDGIIHMASPVDLNADDPKDLIIPAISGTLNILKSAEAHGNRVKRIVYTSSTAAIIIPLTAPRTFTEADWNTVSVDEAERLGRDAGLMHKYRASKTLAERALWNFWEERKATLPWDISVINPPFVFGPALNNFPSPEHQNATTKIWWDNIIAIPPTPESVTVSNGWVDVRDVALAHVLALQRHEAGGERLLIAAGSYVWQDWHNIASKHVSPLTSHQFTHHQDNLPYLPRGFPDIPYARLFLFDASKATRILGPELTYRSMEQTTRDILEDYRGRGW